MLAQTGTPMNVISHDRLLSICNRSTAFGCNAPYILIRAAKSENDRERRNSINSFNFVE